jgi:16S rRNA G966 N2-methylase RsmD
MTETVNALGTATGRRSWRNDTEGKHTGEILTSISTAPTADVRTLGWSDCGHDDFRNGVVLDPFAGSGTTLAAASGLGRDSIGIDLNPDNVHLARERVGLWLEEAS